MVITLSAAEQQLADRVGRARVDECLKFGGCNKQLDTSRSNVVVQIEGAIGELGFCRAFRLRFDADAGKPGHQWANKPDTVDGRGQRIDVKATSHRWGRMMLYKPKPTDRNQYQNVDLFVLTRLHQYPAEVYIIGWCTKAALMDERNLEDKGYGPTYFLNDNDPRFHHL